MSTWLKIGSAAAAVALLAALGCGGASAAPASPSPWGASPANQGTQPQSVCERVPTSQPQLPTDGTPCCKFPKTWVKSCYEEYGKLGAFQCVYEYACETPPKS
jgi:hypothetical protein